MARVTCRCGEKIGIHADSPERIECPKCGARIRLRRPAGQAQKMDQPDDGYHRFYCPCGRRLKVPVEGRPEAGKCPDCGRVVPVPASVLLASGAARSSQPADPDARTEELSTDDLSRLERWAARHLSRSTRRDEPDADAPIAENEAAPGEGMGAPGSNLPSVVKFEAGLRVCPRCRKPVHLGVSHCRECGNPVPRS
jgi:hypothetical protein